MSNIENTNRVPDRILPVVIYNQITDLFDIIIIIY